MGENVKSGPGIIDILPAKFLTDEEIVEHLNLAEAKALWNFRATQIYEALDSLDTRGEGINIAVIDSGVYREHPRLENIVDGRNFIIGQDKEDITDELGHGTQVAGIIGGRDVGIAPKANLYALKVLTKDGGDLVFLRRALHWCLNNKEGINFDIINMSLGTPRYFQEIKSLCEDAYKRRTILVAAAGNEYTGARFPASYREVISVAAVDEDLTHCDFSNIWPTTDIAAPGKNIFSTYYNIDNENYIYHSDDGTSFATPHVTGLLALALSKAKRRGIPLNTEKIKEKLKEKARKLDNGKAIEIAEIYDPEKLLLKDAPLTRRCMYGAGLVQAKEFIEAVLMP